MTPNDSSKIEQLKKTLYSRSGPEVRTKRRLRYNTSSTSDVQTDWEHPVTEDQDVTLNQEYKQSSMSFSTKFFIGSLIFFVVAVALGAFLIMNGENIISANNINITIKGPISIAGGEPVNFDVQVENKNNITLEAVDLDVDFPPGTVNPNDSTKEMREFREILEDIRPGRSADKRITAILYGEENTKRQVQVNVTYRVAGSNAVFKKTKAYDVLISSSPLSLNVNGFKEVTAGQEFELEVILSSNSSNVMKNILLTAVYPVGYWLTSTDVKAEGNRSVWKVGDIPPHGKKTIKFKGQLQGQDGEARVFRFQVGVPSATNASVIGTEYISLAKEILIEKPFMSTVITFDSESVDGDARGDFNTPVRTELSWFNNLPVAVTSGVLSVKLSGNAFDKNSVNPNGGHYQSADNMITWNNITTKNLSNIGPGEEGNVQFTFVPRDFTTPTRRITNPVVNLDLEIQGKRLSERNVPETVTTSSRKTIRISTDLSFSAQLLRTGIQENTGPIPPKAEQTSTYTVTWIADNTVNTVSDAEVKTILPAYVTWTGKVTPSNADVVFNSATNEVSWKIGNINTHTQGTSDSRKASFQIAFTPSVAQVGIQVQLTGPAQITGVDDFTGLRISKQTQGLTTRFNDANFVGGQDIVVR